MSQSRSSSFKVGLFTLVATGLLVMMLAILTTKGIFAPKVECESYFEESINGLTVGSAVKYQGVNIGKVTRIGFPALEYPEAGGMLRPPYDSMVLAEMQIAVDSRDGMTVPQLENVLVDSIGRGLRARVTMAGITGGAFVALELMDPKAYPALTVPWKPRSIYIPSAPGQLDVFLENLESIASGIAKVDFPKLGEAAQTLMGDIDRVVLDDAKPMIDQIEAASGQLRTLLADPALHGTISNLQTASADLAQILGDSKGDLRTFIAALPATIQSIRDLAARIDTAVARDQPQIARLLTQLNATADNLEAVSRQLRTSPAQTIFGQGPPVQQPSQP